MGKRILTRRRGAAKPRLLNKGHRQKGAVVYPRELVGTATVGELIHAPGRTAILAKLHFESGEEVLTIAAEGMSKGQEVVFTNTTQIKPGNVTIISKIPEGTPIYNVEARPRDGGKFCRTAGNAAEIVSHDAKRTVIRLPSGKFRDFHPECRATIGLVAGGGRGDKPMLKAGKKHHAMKAKGVRWPRVRGVAMNPVDHPHGGGGHSYTPGKTSVARGTPPGRKVGRSPPAARGRGELNG